MAAHKLVERPAGTQILDEWFRTHVEFVAEGCWGPPPGVVARIVRGLAELVGQAHGRGLALPGLGPSTVLVDAAGTVSIAVAPGPGSAVDRAADMAGLGAALCVLATGVDVAAYGDPAELLAWQAVGNPCAADLAPLVEALLDPDPARRPDAAGLRMLLTGRPPETGTAHFRLAG